jgi:hypothetical protein
VPVTTEHVLAKNSNENTYSQGYDSDGEIGPFYDAVSGEKDYSSEEEDDDDAQIFPPDRIDATPENLEATPGNLEAIPMTSDAVPINAEPLPHLTQFQIMAMTVNQLKEELGKRKLSKNGVKGALQQRLLARINAPIFNESEAQHEPPQTALIEGFDPSATWRELIHNENPVDEPTRPNHLRGPSVPQNEDEFHKFNFDETWERPPFTAMSQVVKLGQRGQPLKDRRGQTLYEKDIRKEGRANVQWLNKHKLTADSEPHEWFEALLPCKYPSASGQPLQT